jgi:hypothetical protein
VSGKANVLRHEFSRKPFICVMNAVAQDARLSYGARGLLVHMVSLPEEWNFSSDRLATQRTGRRAILGYLRELETFGYVRREREQDAEGKIRTVTRVSDEPVPEWLEAASSQVSTGVRLPAFGKPASGERTPNKEQSTKDRTQSTEDVPTSSGSTPSINVPTSSGSTDADRSIKTTSKINPPDNSRRNVEISRSSRNDDGTKCCALRERIDANRGRWAEADLEFDYDEHYSGFRDFLGDPDPDTERTILGMIESGEKLIVIANTAHARMCGWRVGST